MTNPPAFDELGLDSRLEQAVKFLGWSTPTKIQTQAIPLVMAGRDLVGIAITGSGKTAAFVLPIINQLLAIPACPARRPGVLILVPTRELAQQVGQVISQVSEHLPIRTGIIYGGVGYARQRKTLAGGVEILIATPGRLIDLMNQGHVLLDRVHTLVLDEADRMLDLGFQPELDIVFARLPRERQSLFFSATFPPAIRRLASTLLSDGVELFIDAPTTQVDLLEQFILPVREADKQNLLHGLLAGQIANHKIERCVVFTNSRVLAGRVTRYLSRRGLSVAMMHGGMTQPSRNAVLARLKDGVINILIATDVAARGIDFEALSHVINVELPLSVESYVHRIGRTARAGSKGISLTFATPDDIHLLTSIERHIGQKISVDENHPFAVPLPQSAALHNDSDRGGKTSNSNRSDAGLSNSIQRKVRKTSSGKLAVVEYKVGARRRTLSGKIRSGGGVRQEKDKFAPAWKKNNKAKRPKK